MSQIPRAALLLGLAGVLPFALPLAALLMGMASPFGIAWQAVQILYGLTILAFMSGCLWGFAAKTEDSTGYALSTLPALYGFFILALTLPFAHTSLTSVLFALGFASLLTLDLRAAKLGQTPKWWMSLRVLLTTLVVICLIVASML